MAMHRTHGVNVGIARIFNTYGPRLSPGDGRVVSNFIVQALRGEPLTVYGDGSQTRSLCYVDDEIGGLLALLDSSLTGPVNIGNPDERTVGDLAHFVLEVTGSTSGIVFAAAAHRRPDPALPRHHAGQDRAGMGAYDRPAGGHRADDRVLRTEGECPMTETDLVDLPPQRTYRSLTVIMPVFNERTTVAEVIRRMRAVELPLVLQVIAVDDGSSDGSDKVLGALEDSTVRVIRHNGNQGKGAAIRTGLAEAQGRPHPHSGRRPRVRPQRLAAPARPDPAREGPCRLREPLHR